MDSNPSVLVCNKQPQNNGKCRYISYIQVPTETRIRKTGVDLKEAVVVDRLQASLP